MAPTLNKYAVEYARRYRYIGFMGDDHRPRTERWDAQVIRTLAKMRVGMVYGDDLLQGAALPTAVFMAGNIINVLGWMAPPGLIHLYLDNFWLTFGNAMDDGIRYLPNIVIEHMHPIAGKAPSDAGYVEVNAPDVYAHDAQVFRDYQDSGAFRRDVDLVREMRERYYHPVHSLDTEG